MTVAHTPNDGVIFVGEKIECHGLLQLLMKDEQDVLELLQLLLVFVTDLSLEHVFQSIQLISVLVRMTIAGSNEALIFVEQHPEYRLKFCLAHRVAYEAQVGRHLSGKRRK